VSSRWLRDGKAKQGARKGNGVRGHRLPLPPCLESSHMFWCMPRSLVVDFPSIVWSWISSYLLFLGIQVVAHCRQYWSGSVEWKWLPSLTIPIKATSITCFTYGLCRVALNCVYRHEWPAELKAILKLKSTRISVVLFFIAFRISQLAFWMTSWTALEFVKPNCEVFLLGLAIY